MIKQTDSRFIDPTKDVTGIDAFEEMVHEFRRDLIPDAICSRASGVDSHHQVYRYDWEIHSGGELAVPGFDVVEADASGLVVRVLGFFGPLPPKSV